MKKLILVFSLFCLITSCSSDDKPVLVSNMEITSSNTTLYYDSQIPTLTVAITPENADNKTLAWTSSNPDVISVDAEGKLTLNKFTYCDVTITATNKESGKTATCKLTLALKKADIADYGVIELKDKLGFDLLDRNIGATKAYSSTGSDADKAAAIGYYFQFGNSIPVGTSEGLTNFYNKEYNGGDLDWSVAANTPCPEGWRIPNKEEMKKLTDAAWVDWDGLIQTDEEFDAAKALYNSLLLSKGGYYKIDGATAADRAAATPKLYLSNATYFWSSALNTTSGSDVSDRNFKNAYDFEDNLCVLMGKQAEVNRAMPIRCIK